jgi:hypothetical protein
MFLTSPYIDQAISLIDPHAPDPSCVSHRTGRRWRPTLATVTFVRCEPAEQLTTLKAGTRFEALSNRSLRSWSWTARPEGGLRLWGLGHLGAFRLSVTLVAGRLCKQVTKGAHVWSCSCSHLRLAC